MYWGSRKQDKTDYVTIGSPDEWIQQNCTHYCPLWETKMRDGVCTERKELAHSMTNRFSVGDGITSRSFERCLECQGAIPIADMNKPKTGTQMTKKIVIPELGSLHNCSKCGEEFDAYLNGKNVCWKTCQTCMKNARSERAEVVTQKKLGAKRLLIDTLPEYPVPPHTLWQEALTDEQLEEKMNIIKSVVEKQLEEADKEKLAELQPDKEFWLNAKDGERHLENSFIPMPIADPGHPLWESLFAKDKDLFEQLKALAKSERRDFHNQILYLLETHVDM